MLWFMQVLLCVLGIVAFGASSLSAISGQITEDPTKILQKYLSLDKKGVRLEAHSWQVVRPFVAWLEEPVWGQVVVISQYEVVDDVSEWEILSVLEAKIPVMFEVLGTMHWESVTFVPNPHREIQYFQLKAVGDRWQIVGPQLPPHVGRQRLIDFVRWAELNESGPERKVLFNFLIQQLELNNEKDVQK
ncbi:hypothetical protein [uncultured Nitrospira sp.]|uniref:hypothetical protein n=1 Tax=uncultured Nitrospira sp. TaxID=157176 RepID=UPI003140A509